MSRARTLLKRTLFVAALLFALTLGVVEWQGGFLFPAPQHDLPAVMLELSRPAERAALEPGASPPPQPPAPAVRVLFNPETVEPILTRFAQRESGGRLPEWLLDAVVPYEAAAVTTYDFGSHRIEINALLNARRLDGVIARAFPLERLRREVPEIDWAEDGVQRMRRGLVTLRGTVPMDPKVEEDVWYLWQHAIALPPLEFEGGHMLEAVFDNRTGGAWLVIGSLFRAFDIELDEQETDISLSSLQFITRGRLTMNLEGNRDLRMRLAVEAIPEHKDKLGVINLKVGLEDLLREQGERLREEHGIEFNGEAVWDDNMFRFDYLLEDLERALDVLAAEAR